MPEAYKKCLKIRVKGTHRQAEVEGVTYAKMVRKLGPPTCTREDDETHWRSKTTWHVPMGKSVLTVYDWDDQDILDDWNIGAKTGDKAKALKLKKYLESGKRTYETRPRDLFDW